LELLQLKYFRVLGRLQHVTRAAEQIGIAQPTLSRAIARLEAEVGVPLFHPLGRSVGLSNYGEIFLAHVESALDELHNGTTRLAEMNSSETGTIALGFLRSLGPRFVPDLARRFTAENPAVRFAFSEDSREGLLERLHTSASALCITVRSDDPRVGWRPIGKQELVVIVSPRHRLATRKRVALAELANEPLVMFREGVPVRKQIVSLLRAAGVKPRIASESDESGSIFGLVAAGSGVSIVPGTGASHDVVTLAIEDAGAAREIGLAWISGRYLSPAEFTFRAFVLRETSPDRLVIAATN
jgi:DNA-binding transcriptional LysR family regulator